ncbi:ATV_HP_G0103630.mRNA.1.CDS.1 [Saccharomyces cerevisiae]|nr:ATV_HP_G0103630.mRNA.1.CDS.1 [Saccharomyces cerevisiae]CAI6619475.1 ATV_HP_G0103630.mRNA.1.CDS.1 [Saccharomyces cerevisiae]
MTQISEVGLSMKCSNLSQLYLPKAHLDDSGRIEGQQKPVMKMFGNNNPSNYNSKNREAPSIQKLLEHRL